MAGRKASRAMPQMGFTCYVCPGAPSIITGGEPGNEQAFDNARKLGRAHLDEHATEIAAANRVDELIRVYPRVRSGPTRPAQVAV